MAKEIEETTDDDAPEEAPRRRTTTEVERAVLATLGRRPKRLISIIEESGVCRSSVCRILKALVEAGQASRHEGFYSLPGGEAEPAPRPRAKKPAPTITDAQLPADAGELNGLKAWLPEPAEEAPAEDEPVVFSPEETGILAYLAKPGLLALLAKVERLG